MVLEVPRVVFRVEARLEAVLPGAAFLRVVLRVAVLRPLLVVVERRVVRLTLPVLRVRVVARRVLAVRLPPVVFRPVAFLVDPALRVLTMLRPPTPTKPLKQATGFHNHNACFPTAFTKRRFTGSLVRFPLFRLSDGRSLAMPLQ